MNRDEKQKHVAATAPPRSPAQLPRKLRVVELETRVTPNAIWGD